MDLNLLSSLAVENDTKVVLVVLDGVGGLAGPEGKTSLEAAHTPNLDALAKSGVCGFHTHWPRGSPRAQDQLTSGCSATTRSST